MKTLFYLIPTITLLFTMVLSTPSSAQVKKPRVLILVTSVDKFANGTETGLWLEEFAVPYNTLVQGGADVTVVSPKGGATPVDPHSKGNAEQEKAWANAEKVLRNTVPLTSAVKAADYDAIFAPGGHGPLFDLATDPEVAKLISAFSRQGKPVAAVCHGPAALVGATLANGDSIIKGKKVTAFSDSEEIAAGLQNAVPFSIQQKLATLGGQFSQASNFAEYAVEDGNLITGQNPASSAKVASLLLAKLKK